MRRRATSGVVKTGLSQGARLIIQFVSAVALSRLLTPSEFGVLAMAAPVVAFAAMFQDLGLTQAVVQKPTLTQAEISALFFVSLGMSIALALALAALSPVVSAFYGEPRVGMLTAAMGINIALGGAGALHYALLNRRMQFGVLAIIDVAAVVGSLVASLAFALLYHSFWALYAGSLVGALIPVIGYWTASGWRPSRPRRGSGVSTALRFGANVTGFNLANFFSRNLDNVLIGRVWGEAPLGLYDRAYKLLLLPLQQINGPVSKIMLPVLSQLVDDPIRYRGAFLRVLAQMMLLTLPGIAFMVGTADLLIPTLLGKQWSGASPLFAVLGLASFVQILNNPTGWLFMSQNRTREYMLWGVCASVTCIISFLVGLPYGPIGVAVAYTVGEYIRTPILWWYVTRRGPILSSAVIRVGLPHFLGVLASLAAVACARALLPSDPALVLGVSLVASFAASLLVVAALPLGRGTISQTIGMIGGRFQRAHPS